MTKPKISVIIPVYNGERFLVQTIDSVISQTYSPLEIIVVDDGSTDSSKDILKSFGSKIDVISKINGGVSSARNRGIQQARGDWIAFIDADDFWDPKKLELEVLAISNYPESVVVYTGFRNWLPDVNGQYVVPNPLGISKDPVDEMFDSGWIYHRQLLTNWVLTSTAMVRRTALERSGLFDEEFPVGEDWDLFIRLSRQGTFCKVCYPLTWYRQSPRSLTASVKKIDYASQIIESTISRYGYTSPNGDVTDVEEFKRRCFQRRFNHGLGAFKNKWYPTAVNSFFEAIKFDPFHLKVWVYYSSSFVMKLWNKSQP